VTRYLDRVIAGDAPTPDDWNDHLIAFHRAFNDGTASLVSTLRTASGQTSYDVLAARIKALAPTAQSILDVGCGDGALLALLAQTFSPDVALSGVDLCENEIERARKRVPAASLVCGDAARYEMGRGRYDVATAHLSFMSMPGVRAVIEGLRDALRPGGLLVFVVEDPLESDTIVTLMREAIVVVRAQFPRFTPSVPGREPIERDDALRALLADIGLNTHTIERYVLAGACSPAQLWALLQRTYPLGLLDASLHERIREHTINHAPVGSDGLVRVTLSLRLVVAGAGQR
jgi:trans-aconitate methyltransferase